MFSTTQHSCKYLMYSQTAIQKLQQRNSFQRPLNPNKRDQEINSTSDCPNESPSFIFRHELELQFFQLYRPISPVNMPGYYSRCTGSSLLYYQTLPLSKPFETHDGHCRFQLPIGWGSPLRFQATPNRPCFSDFNGKRIVLYDQTFYDQNHFKPTTTSPSLIQESALLSRPGLSSSFSPFFFISKLYTDGVTFLSNGVGVHWPTSSYTLLLI